MCKKIVTICALLLAIGTIAFLPCLTFQKSKQAFTKPNEMLAVFLGEEKSKTFPAKDDGYVYNRTECTNDEVATWNADTWKLTVSKIKKETKCNVYFSLGFTEKEFAYTGDVEEFSIPVSGNYKLEVWGAQGGSGINYFGTPGAGGYATGTVHLTAGTLLYIYVGEEGKLFHYNFTPGYVFGGGGTPDNAAKDDWGDDGYSGGGATDIRIGEDSLYHRVIVAGGGGGAAGTSQSDFTTTYNGDGGAAGGANGYTGTLSGTDASRTGGTGGTLYSGGISQDGYTTHGSFGLGGQGDRSSGDCIQGGGGGGGWYGGGAGSQKGGGGGGGSSWTYTTENFTAWQTGNAADAANWKLDTKYYLTNAEIKDGQNSTIPTYDGTSTMTGNSGSGHAKITLVR